MKRNSLKTTHGLTILELMIAMIVFAMMMVTLGEILVRGQNQLLFHDAKLNLQSAAREGLSRMALEIRESSPSRVTVTSSGRGLTFQIPTNVSSSGAITWSAPITYQVGGNGTQLVRDDGGGSTTILANDVQTVNFSFVDANTLLYSITTQRTTTEGRTATVTLTGDARFRNP